MERMCARQGREIIMLKTDTDLKTLLKNIDHKGYPAYKETKGSYRFAGYLFCIDHVQGDPFAAPSKVRIVADGKRAGFPAYYYETEVKRAAFEDYLLRKIAKKVRDYSFRAKGSGKSGLISVTMPGQEMLRRSDCTIDAADGTITVRMEIGFPANGRTINARELEKIVFDFLPELVRQTLSVKAHKEAEMKEWVHLAENQQYIREKLAEDNLIAFVANGSVLPRKSGVSSLPMKEAVLFRSPECMETVMEIPHGDAIKGMGIPAGVSLIVGGGYHGKSTLLRALELGVYNHIVGDGREYVITDESAMKLRAEDGRSIRQVDISMFIRDLPSGKDTRRFQTEDASGSTSQAAATVEAIEMGSKVFLIDEDTSATNFMIRDELMQRVVTRDKEPIIPFIERVRELYEVFGISTILVAGSCGAYFHKADHIIQMDHYEPLEITQRAKEEAAKFPMIQTPVKAAQKLSFQREVKKDIPFQREQRIKMKTFGTESISIGKETIDLRLVEQLVDNGQLNALGQMIKHMKLHCFDGNHTLQAAVEHFYSEVAKKGFAAFAEGTLYGNLTIPRKQELYAALNRYRGL